METACYKILNENIFKNVYEPAEDSFCLIDALEGDLELLNRLKPTICLEIGSGSGIVTATLAKALGNRTIYLCSDINKQAAAATKLTCKSNATEIDVIVTDLVEAFQSRLKNSVDLLLFNPPYVVTPANEVHGDNLQIATAGGIRGREVMDRLFPIVPHILSRQGFFYLVCIKDNDCDDIARIMKANGLHMTIVLSRRCGIEQLFVLRFSFQNYS